MDKGILRLGKHREKLNRIVSTLPMEALDEVTQNIMKSFQKYFKDLPKHNVVDMDVFLPRFRREFDIKDEGKWKGYLAVFAGVLKDLDEDTEFVVMQDMHELAMGTKAANLLARYDAGEVENFPHEYAKLHEDYKRGLGIKEASWIDIPIGDLLAEAMDASGIQWRISALRNNLRGLRPGDFGIIAGRPDKGKTTMLSSEVTHMAGQLPEDRNVLWLNNEGPGKRIVPRLYQSATGLLTTEMVELHQQDKLVPAYRSIVGRLDRIRVVDIHGMNVHQVEQIIEANNAGIVIFDMIDNISGFGTEARTDLVLEKMYQHCRELAVKHDFIGIATSQISHDGDGLQYPPQFCLKDSKTGKQGACDFIIMIGSVNDQALEKVRYIGTPKNKLQLPGKPGWVQEPVMIKAEIARYVDLEIEGEDQV
jgi:replicative DNA helicase